MSNIINTYLKIQKCIFSEYQNSLKDANTIYFITDKPLIFIGKNEYMTADTELFQPISNIKILEIFKQE